jgi:hypothetical protein
MTFLTRPILSDRQFTQPDGEVLELSGTTNFKGILKINDIEVSINLQDLQNGYVLSYDGTVIKLQNPNDLLNLEDLDIVRLTGNQIITGLKEFRIAAPNDGSTFADVIKYSIGNDNLYKLHLRNTQNTMQPNGQVGWNFSLTYNAALGIARTKEMIGFSQGGITVIGNKDIPLSIFGDMTVEEENNIANENYRYPIYQYVYGVSQHENGIIVGTNAVKTQHLINDVKVVISGNIHLDAPVNTYRVIGAGGVENTNAYVSLPNYSAFNIFNSRSNNGHYFTSNGNFLGGFSGSGLFTIAPSLTPGGSGNLGPTWKLGDASTNSDINTINFNNTVDRLIRIQIGTTEYDILARIVV